jgi:tetratricopeptide (TPR) repeat protein
LARRRELILIALAGLGWCALLLAPASIVVRIHNTLSDRYAYVPFAGIGWTCGALVVLAHRALAHQSALLASLTAAWIATLFIVSARQVYAWENPLSLYSHAVLTTPLVANSHFRLGTYALKTGDCATAVTILSKAIELDFSHVKARANFGGCLLTLGRFDEARTSLETLVNDFPRHRTGWYNLGVAYRQLGQTGDACHAFGRALELDHRYRKAELALRRGCGQDFRNKGSAP